jgi:hypothetical protein
VEQVNKDIVKYVTAIDEGGIREEAFAQKAG